MVNVRVATEVFVLGCARDAVTFGFHRVVVRLQRVSARRGALVPVRYRRKP